MTPSFRSNKPVKQLRHSVPFPFVMISFAPSPAHSPPNRTLLSSPIWEPAAVQLCMESYVYVVAVSYSKRASYARYGRSGSHWKSWERHSHVVETTGNCASDEANILLVTRHTHMFSFIALCTQILVNGIGWVNLLLTMVINISTVICAESRMP